MIEDKIEQMEKRIQRSRSMSDEQKREFIELLASMKKELSRIQGDSADDAVSIVNFAEASVHESTRDGDSGALARVSRDGLSQSVRKFEASHPDLFGAVNAVCDYLAGLGI
jgi:hypothetical protein